jgi:two-component system heavy metal sensor histidine kinase CusS
VRSISVRLATWYAIAATVTLACLFAIGYRLLQSHLVHGLDLLNAAEFEQIRARLGPDYASLDASVIDARIRESTEFASVLFYIDIDSHRSDGILFYSNNLNRRPIPDLEGQQFYDARMPGIGELRVAAFPLPPFDVTVATPLRQVREVMREYVDVCMALLAAMLAASAVIGFVLSRMALRPVRLIRETARRIGSHNLGERIPVGEVNDEISELARLLNQMFDRLESSFNQIRRFTAEASHELKTPLTLARLQAEKLLVSGELRSPQEEALQVQLEELARLNRIIEELLFLSQAEAQAVALAIEPRDPGEFLNSLAIDARVLADHHGHAFELCHEGTDAVAFDRHRIRQVLLNLISNALQAGGPPHSQTIVLKSRVANGRWRVSVEDQGRGVPPDQLERIFERFVRLDPGTGKATGGGLGLAISRSIIELHQGWIRAELPNTGPGLRVVFEIPACP